MNLKSLFLQGIAVGLLVQAPLLPGSMEASGTQRDMQKEFLDVVELAPFEIVDDQLAVSVFARTRGDRNYAVRFAEEVLDYTYQSINGSPGLGLVIVGEKGEPHPIFVYYQFMDLAEQGRLDPRLQSAIEELDAMIQEWQDKVKVGGMDRESGEMRMDFETVIPAIPLPLEGVGSKLYQIAWVEKFDQQRLARRFEALTPEELASDDLSAFDWVFFLPHKSEFGKVLDKTIDAFMDHKKPNFFTAAAIRTAVFSFKPWIKSAFERLRKGMLYLTLLRARTDYSDSEKRALTQRFTEALEFDGRKSGQSKRDFVIQELEDQIEENLWFHENPFKAPEPLAAYDPDAYRVFEGKYSKTRKPTHEFLIRKDKTYWKYRDREPQLFFPASETLLIHEKGQKTLEFFLDDKGEVTAAMVRWKDGRNIFKKRR